MQVYTEQLIKNWWAEGDMPVHTTSRVVYLVDGRSALLTFCLHFLKAHKYIYIANWGMSPDLELVRGKDHRAGLDGSPEQETLVAGLRAQGLEQADIDFWCTHGLSVFDFLSSERLSMSSLFETNFTKLPELRTGKEER